MGPLRKGFVQLSSSLQINIKGFSVKQSLFTSIFHLVCYLVPFSERYICSVVLLDDDVCDIASNAGRDSHFDSELNPRFPRRRTVKASSWT